MIYRAKTFYRGDVATNYDKERFLTLKGRVYDWFEKRSVEKALFYLPKKYNILDIPCGTGRITEHLRNKGYEVSGADISVDMLKEASNKTDINYYLRDITLFKFPKHMFQIITCVSLMGHLPMSEKIRALRCMKRTAQFLVITFYMRKKPIDHWHPVSPLQLTELLHWCNLKIINKYPVCPGWSDGVTYLLT